MKIDFNKGYKAQAGLHPSELKREGSAEYLFNSKGEMNATDKADVAMGQKQFLQALSSGQAVASTKNYQGSAEKAALKALNNQLLAAIKSNDKRSAETTVAAMTNMVQEYAQRDGFARKFLKQIPVTQGQLPMLTNDTKTIIGYTYDAGGVNVVPVVTREKKFFLQEFEIIVKVFMDAIEVHQAAPDFAERKLAEMKEAVLVQEDKRWKALADATIGALNSGNELQIYNTGLTASAIGNMRAVLDNTNIPAQYLLIAANLVKDFYGPLATSIDLFHYYQILETGMLGQIAGLTVITDATRVTTQKVLNAGEAYVIGNPEFHGAYSDRSGLSVTEYNPAMTENGKTGKGWLNHEILSMIVSNGRSVVKGLIS
jgi:hypothetical protein